MFHYHMLGVFTFWIWFPSLARGAIGYLNLTEPTPGIGEVKMRVPDARTLCTSPLESKTPTTPLPVSAESLVVPFLQETHIPYVINVFLCAIKLFEWI